MSAAPLPMPDKAIANLAATSDGGFMRVEQLDAGLSVFVDTARRQRPFLDEDERVNAYCVVGSLVSGLGTPTSDLDLYVFTSDRDSADALATQRGTGKAANIRVDTEVYPVDAAHGFIDECAEFRVTEDNSSQLYSIEQSLKFIGILASGCFVVRDSVEFTDLRSRMAAHHHVFRRLAAARAGLFACNLHEDVIGFVRTGDVDGALRCSHELLHFAMDAWCCARGDLYPGRKWVWKRLCRLADTQAIGDLRPSFIPEAARPSAGLETVRHRISQAQSLLGQALLLSWATTPGANRVPLTVPRARRFGRYRLWRSPQWSVRRYADSWCLFEPTQALDVPFTAIVMWALAGGLGTADLIAAVVERSRAWFDVRISAETAQSLVERLVEFGVLVQAATAPIVE